MLAKSDGLHSKSNRIKNSIDKKAKKVEQMKLDADKLLIDIRDIMGTVEETVINVENYESNEDHVKLPIALKEAQMYFDDISERAKNLPNSNEVNKCGVDHLDYWTNTYEEQSTKKMKLDNILAEQKNLLSRLDDLKNLTHRVFRDSSETEAFITKNKKDLERLREKTAKINDEYSEIEKLIDTNVIAASSSKLESLQDSFEKAEVEDENLIKLQEEVEKFILEREDELNEIRDKILPEAQKHADDLSQRSKIIVNLFQSSKDGAQVAIMAGTAHKNITEAIHAAKIAANEAQEAAKKSEAALYPVDEETFAEKGEDLRLESEAIQEDAEEQIKKIEGKI
jgi:laminin alpha 1/2